MAKVMFYDSSRRGAPPLEEIRGAFKYRHLILQLVRRDILTRYKRSFLGIAWTLLNPLGMTLVLTVAFSQIFRFQTPYGYAAYVLTGFLAWTFFSQTTTASMVNLVWGGGLLNRIYIPRSSFALAAIGTGIVNMGFATIPLLFVMMITRVPINISLTFLPVSVILLAGFALGLGLLISTLAVYFPDVAEMYQIVLTAWFYLTPIIYPEEALPEAFRFWILLLNPMYHLVKLFRMPVYYGRFPTWPELAISILISFSMLIAGWWIFSKKSDEFSYRI
jgi:ABC-type polysaccharide/polyol phosphate export permease